MSFLSFKSGSVTEDLQHVPQVGGPSADAFRLPRPGRLVRSFGDLGHAQTVDRTGLRLRDLAFDRLDEVGDRAALAAAPPQDARVLPLLVQRDLAVAN